jgi:hypothetical protein
MLTGASLMFTVTPATAAPAIYGYTVLIAVGAGLGSQVAYSVAAAKVGPHDQAAAVGFINVAQIGSSAIALAVSGSVFQNSGFANLQVALAGRGFADVELRGALAGAQSALLAHADPEVVALAIGAIARTISHTYALVIAAGALALLAALFMRRERLKLGLVPGA